MGLDGAPQGRSETGWKSAISESPATNVTRLGDLLDFGQLFKNLWQQLIRPNLPHY